jgi:hypothetical protein
MLRCVRVTIFVVEVSVYSLIYPACKERAPYYIVICGLSVSPIFFRIISKRQDFGEEKFTEHKMCIAIFPNICLKHHSKKNSTTYYTFFVRKVLRLVSYLDLRKCCAIPVATCKYLDIF